MEYIVFSIFSYFIRVDVDGVLGAAVTAFVSVAEGALSSRGAGRAAPGEGAALAASGARAGRRGSVRQRPQPPPDRALRTLRHTNVRQTTGQSITAVAIRDRGSAIARGRCTVWGEYSSPAAKLCEY